MRIVHWIQALVAVLAFAAVLSPVCCNDYPNTVLENRSHHNNHHKRDKERQQLEMRPGRYRSLQDNVRVLRHDNTNGTYRECCPAELEMIEPLGGKNLNGEFVDLYSDGNYKQRFYEWSCREDVLDKPCNFTEKRVRNDTRCEQRYSYTYALIKDRGNMRNDTDRPSLSQSGHTWTLDYIRVRSGCACVVRQPPKHKRKRKKKSMGKRQQFDRPKP